MNLELIRKEFTDKSTIGELYINGKFFCFTLEDKDRGLQSTDPLILINTKKIWGETAIPYGTYEVKLTMSNRFKRVLPILLNVKGYTGVRIHRGNTAEHSHGCPLVGYKKAYNTIFESTKAENDLMKELSKATQTIILEIKK
jgi:hypothetical protein